MKWEIYKQLKPVEREYYDKEIVNKEPLFDFDFMSFNFFVFVQLFILGFIAIIGIGLKRDVSALLNLMGTLQKITLVWLVLVSVIGTIYIMVNQTNEKKWIRELGYEITRRK